MVFLAYPKRMRIYGKGKGPLALRLAENMRNRKALTLGRIWTIALNENKPLKNKGLLAPILAGPRKFVKRKKFQIGRKIPPSWLR
jgi:hypothetical protein